MALLRGQSVSSSPRDFDLRMTQELIIVKLKVIRALPRQNGKQTNLVIIGERDLFTRFSDRLTDDEIVPSLFGVLESLSAIDKDICSNGHSLQIRKRQSNTGQLAETKWQRAIPIREKMEVQSEEAKRRPATDTHTTLQMETKLA